MKGVRGVLKKRRELHDQRLGGEALLTALTRRESEAMKACYNRCPLSATDLFPTSINPGGRCETAGKQIERCAIATFQIARTIGFKGEFRQWEELLRVGE